MAVVVVVGVVVVWVFPREMEAMDTLGSSFPTEEKKPDMLLKMLMTSFDVLSQTGWVAGFQTPSDTEEDCVDRELHLNV